MNVEVGQIWQDNDPRYKRLVEIVELPKNGFSRVSIVTLGRKGPITKTEIARFGKLGRSGFTFVEDVS